MKNNLITVTGLGSLVGLAVIGGVAIATNAVANEQDAAVAEDSIADATPVVCADSLAQGDEAAYAQVAVADCMYVGCGGIF